MFKKLRDFYGAYKGISKAQDWSQQLLNWQSLNTSGGTRITEPARQSYLVQKCVNIISQNAPQAPLEFFLVSPANPKEPQKLPMTAPINQLFNNPNENMSRYDFMAATSAYMTLYGEAFWYFVQSRGQVAGTTNMPAEIWVLDPRKMKEVVEHTTGVLIGWLFDGKVSLTKDEVCIFKNINPYNPFRGLSPLDAVEIEINSDYKAGVYQEKFFDNGSVPSMVLETGENDNSTVAELRKIKRMWEQQHQGSNNAKKMGVLRGGMTLKPIGLTQMEMDFINSRNMTRDIVFSIFGVPKTIAGFTEELNRATAEVQKRLFWQETVKPQLLRIQHTLTNKFLYKVNVNMVAKFDFLQIDELQRNFEDEVNVASKLWMMGFARNELNDRFGLGFDDDTEFGDDKFIPLNMLNLTDDTIIPSNVSEPRETVQINTSIDAEVVKLLDYDKTKKIDKREAQIQELFKRTSENYEKMMTGRLKKYFFTQRLAVLKSLDKDTKLDIFEVQDKKLTKVAMPIYNEAATASIKLVNDILKKETVEIDTGIIFSNIDKLKLENKTIKEQLLKLVVADAPIEEVKENVKKIYNFIDKKAITIAKTHIYTLMDEITYNEYKKNGLDYRSITNG